MDLSNPEGASLLGPRLTIAVVVVVLVVVVEGGGRDRIREGEETEIPLRRDPEAPRFVLHNAGGMYALLWKGDCSLLYQGK